MMNNNITEFTKYNTEGLSQDDLDKINQDWRLVVESKSLETNTEDYNIELDRFVTKLFKEM